MAGIAEARDLFIDVYERYYALISVSPIRSSVPTRHDAAGGLPAFSRSGRCATPPLAGRSGTWSSHDEKAPT